VLTLSVAQPWASLIMLGIKLIENRSWPTSHRGRLAIHASARCDIHTWREIPALRDLIHLPPVDRLPSSAILGTVEVVECVRSIDLPPELACDPFAGVNCWCWVLAKPRLLVRPWPCKGKLRLWESPAGLRLEQADGRSSC
jgi:hypothetical protein